MSKVCIICGKPGYKYYPYCKEHLDMKADGKIVKCDTCGEWHLSDQPCPKCNPITKKDDNTNETIDLPKITCLLCGEDSNGYHFCTKCYKKYSSRSIDIRVVNCTEVEIMDEYGNKTKKCADGRYVRSEAERAIYNYFFYNNIRVVYEKKIKYTDENGEIVLLHPDFYLPDSKLYIEYNGLSNKKYLQSKEFAYNIYQQLGLNVVIFSGNEIDDIEDRLNELLNNY